MFILFADNTESLKKLLYSNKIIIQRTNYRKKTEEIIDDNDAENDDDYVDDYPLRYKMQF